MNSQYQSLPGQYPQLQNIQSSPTPGADGQGAVHYHHQHLGPQVSYTSGSPTIQTSQQHAGHQELSTCNSHHSILRPRNFRYQRDRPPLQSVTRNLQRQVQINLLRFNMSTVSSHRWFHSPRYPSSLSFFSLNGSIKRCRENRISKRYSTSQWCRTYSIKSNLTTNFRTWRNNRHSNRLPLISHSYSNPLQDRSRLWETTSASSCRLHHWSTRLQTW